MQTPTQKAYGLKLVSPLVDSEMVEKRITVSANETQKIILEDNIFAAYYFHVQAGATLLIEEKVSQENLKRHIYVYLEGGGAKVAIESRVDISGATVVDNLHAVVHKASHTISEITLRGIIDQEARAIYRSTITAEPGLENVTGKQNAQFLTFSSKARIDAIPALEVATESVTCNHSFGVTTIREKDLFYLQARGHTLYEAKTLLREAFLV